MSLIQVEQEHPCESGRRFCPLLRTCLASKSSQAVSFRYKFRLNRYSNPILSEDPYSPKLGEIFKGTMQSPKMILIGGGENQYKLLAIHLEMSGFDLLYAPNVVTGLCMIEVNKPELILLDIGLPVPGDWESCRRVRELSKAPILILSDRKDEADVLQAFKQGADDYLQKPYSSAELIARAEAIIRRSAKENSPPNQVISGEIVIDLGRKHVIVDGQRVELTPKEFHLLKVLAVHANNTIPTGRLLNEVWGIHYDDDHHFVKQYIWNLRRKIEGNPKDPQHLITRRGYGYLFK